MENKKYQKELSREELLHAVLNSMTEIGQQKESNHIIPLIEKLLGEILTAEWATIWLVDRKKSSLYSKVSTDEQKIVIPIKKGLLSKCYTQKEPFFSNYVMIEDEDFIEEIDNIHNYKIKNMIILPVKNSDNEVIAVCQAMTNAAHLQTFTQKDIELFLSIENFIIKMLSMLQGNHFKKKHQKDSQKIESLITDIEKDYQIELLHGMNRSIAKVPALIEQLHSNQETKEALTQLERVIQSIGLRLTIMNDLIDLPEGDKDILNPLEVNLIKEFNFIGTLLKDKIIEKNIDCRLFIDPAMPQTIEVDIQRIKEAFFILLNNGLYNTPKDGILKCDISLDDTGENITFCVTDSGTEVTAEEQKALLHMSKNQKITSPRQKGMYLCLYECEMLGSEVMIESSSEETSFYFSISMSKKAATPFFEKSELQESIITIVTSNNEAADVLLLKRYLEAFQVDQTLVSVVPPEQLTDMGYVSAIFCMTNTIDTSLAQSLLDQGNVLIFMDTCKETSSIQMLVGNIYQLETKFSPIEIYKILLEKPMLINPFAKKTLLLDGYGTLESFIIKAIDNPNLEIESVNTSYDFLQKFNDAIETETQYDFILMDVSSIDGVSLPSIAKHIRVKEQTHKLKKVQIVAILSSDALERDIDKHLIAGVDNVYTKPIGSRKVKEIFRDLL